MTNFQAYVAELSNCETSVLEAALKQADNLSPEARNDVMEELKLFGCNQKIGTYKCAIQAALRG